MSRVKVMKTAPLSSLSRSSLYHGSDISNMSNITYAHVLTLSQV